MVAEKNVVDGRLIGEVLLLRIAKVDGSQGPQPTFVSASGTLTRRKSNGVEGRSPEVLPLLGRPLGPADLTLVCGTCRFL